MKLFSFTKNIRNQCLFLGLTVVIILAMFCFYIKKTTIIEGFFRSVRPAPRPNNSNTSPPPPPPPPLLSLPPHTDDKSTDTDDSKQPVHSKVRGGNFVEDVALALEKGVNTWTGEKVTGHDYNAKITLLSDTVTVKRRPDVSAIISDNCSTQSLLSSEYKTDICTEYEGDYKTIDSKCKLLSNKNCNIPVCCVLLNGNKCVAGNVNGPTYLTDQGNQIDFNYYTYRGKIYPDGYDPNAVKSSGYIKNCGKYTSNSANISKSCIVQLFNDSGCSNASPDALINDSTVNDYSALPLDVIKNDIQSAVNFLKSKIKLRQDDSRILCNGKNRQNPCDNFNDKDINVSKQCMNKMVNDAGCPTSDLFDDKTASDNSKNFKKQIRREINFGIGILKRSINAAPTDSDERAALIERCYGKHDKRTLALLERLQKIKDKANRR